MKATGPRSLQRCNTRRTSTSPERYSEGSIRPSALRLCVHAVACLVSLILGFRFSREALLVVVAFRHSPGDSISQKLSSNLDRISEPEIGLKFPYVPGKATDDAAPEKLPLDSKLTVPPVKSSRVHVGRHEILIRPWPRPNPLEVAVAHALLQRVQQEQRRLYVAGEWRRVIVITPTFSRTFQWAHLTGLMHTLMSVPGPLTWIVVEAGGVSNETASLLARSGLECFHLSVDQSMPAAWSQREPMESLMRVTALRFVRERKLDGVIVFADDSNTHSLRLFDEVQNVKWLGAVSVGILGNYVSTQDTQELQGLSEEGRQLVSVQGPACNESCHLIGWHILPRLEQSVKFDDVSKTVVSTKDLVWAGFVLNSRILWEDAEKPDYISDWDEWTSNQVVPSSPLGLVKNQVFVEPLGNCGREVLLWWLRIEARADSKFPSRWVIDPPLEVVVPSKRTPWPEARFEQPSLVHSAESLNQSDKHRVKHSGRTRSKQGARHSNKRRQGLPSKVEDFTISQGQ
ncbi:hypothetical protein O6H91_12G066400 [Diphasiastrum complanatum]|uniref:Uncharacterized protein n=2 Tax=Diphasiastrum complanatum TaxID=34168 RepID=A0ACC2C3Z4_DIPCM|nr:hypothetical protein O6H91_12G066400 [Diphasiastrum complanatum]KAJ7536373.1 hypothetical protein O6H91_12G066400 [Diphasiastrum complanatum]